LGSAKRDINFAGFKAYGVKSIDFSDFSELTIASGAITVTQACHTVDTQGDAASDDLDTINGGTNGMLLFIRPENDARTVVVKHGTGNIWISGGADVTLDDVRDLIALVYDGTKWSDLGGAGVIASAHARSHLITSTSDHSPTGLTASQLIRLNAAATALESSGKVIGDFADAGHTHGQLHDRSHDVESSSDHAASSKKGLFVKTNSSTGAIEVVAHGLSYGDVGAEASGAVSTHAGLTTGVHGVGAGIVAKVGDIAVDGNLSAAAQAAIAASHARSHLITSTSDHSPTGLTASQLIRLNAGATALESSGKTISDFEASGAVSTHAGLTTGVHGVGAGTVAKVGDIATDTNLSAAMQALKTTPPSHVHPTYGASAINRLLAVVPTASVWGVNPANLNLSTDNDFTTSTGIGNKVLGGAGNYGQLDFDMGAIYPSLLLRGRAFHGNNIVGGSNTSFILTTSPDNANWYYNWGYYRELIVIYAANYNEVFDFLGVANNARYVRLLWYGAAAGTWYGALTELQALDFGV
jgi:hypothetical protein